MSNVLFTLSREHLAMLDAIKVAGKHPSRNRAAKELLEAVLEDDAVARGMAPRDPSEKVIHVNWRGRR